MQIIFTADYSRALHIIIDLLLIEQYIWIEKEEKVGDYVAQSGYFIWLDVVDTINMNYSIQSVSHNDLNLHLVSECRSGTAQ